MDKKLNTTYEFEFYDGTKAKMTLFFYALHQLKEKNEALYRRYNKTMNRMGAKGYEYDELDSLVILYTAYVCANMNDENLMDEETFLMKCGGDRKAVAMAVQKLTQPKN